MVNFQVLLNSHLDFLFSETAYIKFTKSIHFPKNAFYDCCHA